MPACSQAFLTRPILEFSANESDCRNPPPEWKHIDSRSDIWRHQNVGVNSSPRRSLAVARVIMHRMLRCQAKHVASRLPRSDHSVAEGISTAVILCDLEGRSIEQVAKELQLSVKALLREIVSGPRPSSCQPASTFRQCSRGELGFRDHSRFEGDRSRESDTINRRGRVLLAID